MSDITIDERKRRANEASWLIEDYAGNIVSLISNLEIPAIEACQHIDAMCDRIKELSASVKADALVLDANKKSEGTGN